MKILLSLLLFCFLPLWGTTTAKTSQEQEEKLMRLSLDVMLYNKDLIHAFEIASKGTRRFEKKAFWLEQAAQIAQWLGKPDIAKKYYMKLLEQSGSQKYAVKVETLAKATYDLRTLVNLYEKTLMHDYDKETVEKLYKLYYDLGYLEQGYAFLKQYQKRHFSKLILKKAILLAFLFQNPKEIHKAYTNFTKRFGMDKELLYQYAKLLFSQKKYLHALQMIQMHEKEFCPEDTRLCNLYANLAYILKQETTLRKTLSLMQKNHTLNHNKEMLFLNLLEKKDPKEALKIAKTAYQKSHSSELFYKVAYLAIQLKNFEVLRKLLHNLSPDEKKRAALSWQYWIICAQTAQYFQENKKALICYHKALKLAAQNSTVHENYLWFLIDNKYLQALQKELWFLKKMPSLRNKIPFPVAVGYFNLRQSIPAKISVEKMLRQEPKNWQITLLYADILSLYGEKDGCSLYLNKAWKFAHKEYTRKKFCTKEESKCYDYIRLGINFQPVYTQKYLALGKDILKPSVLSDLYSAFLHQEGYVSAEQQTSHTPAYESQLFEMMQSNPENDAFANSFINLTAQKGTIFETKVSTSKRGTIRIDNLYLSYRHKLSRNRDLKLEIDSQQFTLKHPKKHLRQDEISLTLYHSLKNKAFRFQTGIRQGTTQYTFMRTSLRYNKKHFTLYGSLSYHEYDDTTTQSLLEGYRNRLALDFSYNLNKYETLSINMHTSAYYLQNSKNNGIFTQLQYTRYLHLAYPDIYTQLFSSFQHYSDKNSKLPPDFWQSGINAGIGMQAKETFHRQWKSYANATLLYNSRTETGYSFLLGTGKRCIHRDSIFIELYYTNGIGKYQEEYFSIQGKYLLW